MNIIRLENVELAYRRYASAWSLVCELLIGKVSHETVYALQGISLALAKGESLGIVGDNGAGKTSLLRVLAGVLQPTAGQCEVQGRRAALLELGAGLQPQLSGLDNIRLGLALRGLSQTAIKDYLPQVIEFAELGDAVMQSVKTYSSGMTMRMGFALATVVEPDVLIVDEALSVGDQYFQKKSLTRLQQLVAQGASLVFCSHNLYQVREMCQKAVWLEHGRVRLYGDAQMVADAYQDHSRSRGDTSRTVINQTPTVSDALHPYLSIVDLVQGKVAEAVYYQTGQPFGVKIVIALQGHPPVDVHVGVVIRRNDEVQCYGISTLHDGVSLQGTQRVTVSYVMDALPLLAGRYCLEVWLIDRTGLHVYDSRTRCCPFIVQQVSQQQGIGICQLPHRWEINP